MGIRAQGALWLILLCAPAHGNWVCKLVTRVTGWVNPPAPSGVPADPGTRVSAYLRQVIPPPEAPGQEIKVVDLGAANYQGKETGVSDSMIRALLAMGYKPTIYVNDLEQGPTDKTARALKAKWGDKVKVQSLHGDYTSAEYLAKVKALKPQLVFMMNPGHEVIEALGGNKAVSSVMGNMAAVSEYGLYFRTAFNEQAPREDFRGYFPQTFMQQTFGQNAHRFGEGDSYQLREGVMSGTGGYGVPHDYLIRPPQDPSR